MQHKDGGYERDRAGRNVFDVAEVLSFMKMAEMFPVKTISASLQPRGDRQRQATSPSTAASPQVQLFPRRIRIRRQSGLFRMPASVGRHGMCSAQHSRHCYPRSDPDPPERQVHLEDLDHYCCYDNIDRGP